MLIMNNRSQKGFSLIELMVSTVVGMIIIAGATNVYITTVVSSSDTLKQSKLNQELSTLMSVMAGDILRAGVTGNLDYVSPQTNAFNQVDNTALEVIDNVTDNNQVTWANAGTGGSCIVYTYDANLNGTVDNTDIFGFRLNNGVVEMRQQGDVVNNTRHDSCNDAEDTWLQVTDGRVVNVTNLTFAFDNSECINTREPNDADEDGNGTNDNSAEMDCYDTAPVNGSGNITVEVRQIDITLTGQLVADASVSASLNQSVRVRNDLIRQR
jgi:prepilin peptidase dependent protein B